VMYDQLFAENQRLLLHVHFMGTIVAPLSFDNLLLKKLLRLESDVDQLRKRIDTLEASNKTLVEENDKLREGFLLF
jgi:cell division protein FtsB